MKIKWFEKLEEGLLALFLALMTVVTFAQVIARYVFNYSFVWALELSIFLFGALIFLGISYGVRVNAHIGVDALVRVLPNKAARVAAVVACTLCLVYACIVLYGSWVYVERIYTIGIFAQDIPIPQWVPRTVMPLGFGLLLIRFLILMADILRGRRLHLLHDEAQDAMKYASDDTSVLTPEHKQQ